MGAKLTQQGFIEKCQKAHKDFYVYDKVIYINSNENIIVTCPIHGDYEQNSYIHSKGYGCSSCMSEKLRKDRKLSDVEIIEQFRKKHGDKFSYEEMIYTGLNSSKIKIICPEHGVFEQYPKNHLKYGCAKCAGNKSYTMESFLSKVEPIHNHRYLYCLPEVFNNKTKIQIHCEKHGIFEQVIGNHTNLKQGCPNCNISKGEESIKQYLEKREIEYTQEKTFKNCVNVSKLRFDFYLPKYNLCIEFDGVQHFKAVEQFGGNDEFERTKQRDKLKTNYCIENNIDLLRISYDEYEKIENILDQCLEG